MSFNRRTENSSFGGQGLASGVPRPGADGDRESRDSAWKGSSGGSGTWSSSRNRSNRDDVDTVSDKFAAAFGRGGGGGGGRGEDRDRERGGDRRGGREDPAPLKMNSRNFGEIAPREERPARGFGGEREGGFGGDREERPARGGFGGGDREDRPARGGFGGGDREDRPARGGFGGGDSEDRPARGGFGGGDREYRPRERRDEGGWEDDARFANKFSSGGRGGGDRRGGDRGGDRRGGDRGPSDYLPRRERDAIQGGAPDFSAPLPTAPKSAASNSATVPKQSVFDMALANKGAKQSKPKKETKKTESESTPTPAAPVEVAAPVKPADSKVETREVVTAALSSGVKGAALSSSITSAYAAKDVTIPISLFAAVSAVLEHVAGVTGAFTSKWYKPDEFGAALKDIVSVRPVKEQVDALYAVQAYCAGLKFPKLDVNGKQKKLIEVIFTALLVSEVIDVDTILAWADDEVDRDVPGRVDAIVQMTTMLATLREPDEVEEEDFDADDLNRQYVK